MGIRNNIDIFRSQINLYLLYLVALIRCRVLFNLDKESRILCKFIDDIQPVHIGKTFLVIMMALIDIGAIGGVSL